MSDVLTRGGLLKNFNVEEIMSPDDSTPTERAFFKAALAGGAQFTPVTPTPGWSLPPMSGYISLSEHNHIVLEVKRSALATAAKLFAKKGILSGATADKAVHLQNCVLTNVILLCADFGQESPLSFPGFHFEHCTMSNFQIHRVRMLNP